MSRTIQRRDCVRHALFGWQHCSLRVRLYWGARFLHVVVSWHVERKGIVVEIPSFDWNRRHDQSRRSGAPAVCSDVPACVQRTLAAQWPVPILGVLRLGASGSHAIRPHPRTFNGVPVFAPAPVGKGGNPVVVGHHRLDCLANRSLIETAGMALSAGIPGEFFHLDITERFILDVAGHDHVSLGHLPAIAICHDACSGGWGANLAVGSECADGVPTGALNRLLWWVRGGLRGTGRKQHQHNQEDNETNCLPL